MCRRITTARCSAIHRSKTDRRPATRPARRRGGAGLAVLVPQPAWPELNAFSAAATKARDPGRRRTAFVSSLLILAMTTQAAPLMWHVGSAENDPVLLAALLNSFTFWTNLRFLCADVSFIAVLSALTIAALRGGAAEELAGSIAAPSRMGQA